MAFWITTSSDFPEALVAAKDGDLCLLKEMAGKVNLRETKDAKGRNALHWAAVNGHLESPVHSAASGRRESVLRYLLDRGGDPVRPDLRGTTPLHFAAEEASQFYGTPLHLAASQGQDQVMKILLEHGADPKRVVNYVFTPLLMACNGPSLKCAKLLVEAGADVNFRSPSGPVILMEAVDDGFTEIVKFLLEAGADPNIADEDGRIPIMCAGAHGKRELVEILFPWTKPIPSMPEWSVDGIIRGMRYLRFEAQGAVLEEHIADAKSSGKEAFAKGEYFAAVYFYGRALDRDPLDATLLANISLCWLRVRDGKQALSFAQKCRMMCPRWSKAWYREGAALRFLKHYRGAVDAFKQALKLDPASNEIKNALGEATDAMRNTTRS
ncbi:hypothetical protein BDA96_03G135200 [Sorghum bicolor]|uniref:Uncharacterized protein n=1 Tax=Sorghum bicolor TaxID=4558 RepID=A0A921RB69_SORBI|nr:hypothetical protein BDA96_03G135200 [Sorghum bicolor]